jgi:hypothetical protein
MIANRLWRHRSCVAGDGLAGIAPLRRFHRMLFLLHDARMLAVYPGALPISPQH